MTTLESDFDKLRETALAVKAERDRFRDALHKIAFEPFGPAEASNADVLESITLLARKALKGDS